MADERDRRLQRDYNEDLYNHADSDGLNMVTLRYTLV